MFSGIQLNFIRFLFSNLETRLSAGLFHKLRHAFPRPVEIWCAWKQVESVQITPDLNDRVVVVGLGPAAIACLQELKREGFSSVYVVAQDLLFGGKCVNQGCMPIEYTLRLDCPIEERRDQVQLFIADLRQDIEKQFKGLGYDLQLAEVTAIEGKTIRFSDGGSLAFDRLIVAVGNQNTIPNWLSSNKANPIDMDAFWQLKPGIRVTIFAGGNASALALGDVALALGLIPTILLTSDNALAKLPSFRYFVKELTKRGVKIYENCRILSIRDDLWEVRYGKNSILIESDCFLILDKAEPRFIEIDGKFPKIYDLDLQRACLPSRPDVVFLGDGGGFFTAAEAELQARLLMRAWKYREILDMRTLGALPISFHARQSLGMVGAEWTYLAQGWSEIDFRSLGWSKAHGIDGKIWYLLNQKTGYIEGLHICHTLAPELICLAAALISYPIWDSKWLNTSIHPAAAEIFKVLANDAMNRIPYQAGYKGFFSNNQLIESQFLLPDLGGFNTDNLPLWVNKDQYLQALVSEQPHSVFSIYYALAQLVVLTSHSPSPWLGHSTRLLKDQTGSYYLPGQEVPEIQVGDDGMSCNLSYGKYRVRVTSSPH